MSGGPGSTLHEKPLPRGTQIKQEPPPRPMGTLQDDQVHTHKASPTAPRAEPVRCPPHSRRALGHFHTEALPPQK